MSYLFDFSYITTYERYFQSIDTTRITFIGSGTYGRVYKVFINGQIPIAVKKIVLEDDDYQKKIDIYEREVEFLKSINHPNIIKVYFSFMYFNVAKKKRTYYIGMEYAITDLKKILSEKIFTEQEVSSLAQQLYRGLELIQSKNSVHRDIKPANIVLGTDGFYKLCDFGEVQIQDQSIQTMSLQDIAGSPAYFSPELYNIYRKSQNEGELEIQLDQILEYNPAKSEVFSFGLVILRCLLGINGKIQRCNQDFQKIEEKMNNCVSNHMKTFLRGCLSFDRNNRYTFKQIKEIFEYDAIQAYFEQKEFNAKNSYELMQIQMEEFRSAYQNIQRSLAQENSQLKNEISSYKQQENQKISKLEQKVDALQNELSKFKNEEKKMKENSQIINPNNMNQGQQQATYTQAQLPENYQHQLKKFQQQPNFGFQEKDFKKSQKYTNQQNQIVIKSDQEIEQQFKIQIEQKLKYFTKLMEEIEKKSNLKTIYKDVNRFLTQWRTQQQEQEEEFQRKTWKEKLIWRTIWIFQPQEEEAQRRKQWIQTIITFQRRKIKNAITERNLDEITKIIFSETDQNDAETQIQNLMKDTNYSKINCIKVLLMTSWSYEESMKYLQN